MKSKNFLVISLVLLICVAMYKKQRNVAQPLPRVSKQVKKTRKAQIVKKKTPKKRKRRKKQPSFKISQKSIMDDGISIYKKGAASQKALKDFKRRTYLKTPNFSEFNFADFSEDDVALLVGINDFGDKLSLVATRAVIKTEKLIDTLKKDPTFLNASDPDFKVELMKPVMNMKKRKGFSEVQVWKSHQNNKDYYMFYAPREDGQGAYGILLDGKRENLEANEDYYEQQFQKIEAESGN